MTVPVGTILPFAGASAPADYLLCYGQAVSRTTFATLFGAVGTTYGTGDGSTTFNVPDLRGRVMAGQDDMGGTSANRLTGQPGGVDGDTLGAAGGGETESLTPGQLAEHTHNIGYPTSPPAFAGNGSTTLGVQTLVSTSNVIDEVIETTGTGEGEDGEPHNNVQPTLIVNYIIYAGAPVNLYVTEDGADFYVTEDGADNYVTE